MANLGTIGTLGCLTKSTRVGNPAQQSGGIPGCRTKSMIVGRPPMRLQSLVVGREHLAIGGEDISIGLLTAPSIRFDASGRWRFRWLLAVGTRTIQVNALHSINQNPRPSLFIAASPAISIPVDVEAFAPPGTGTVTIGPVLLNITTQGVVWVELRCNLVTNVGFFPCYFDKIVRT